MVSYYRPIVTLCLKCTVFEIWRHIGRKSPKKTHLPSSGTFLWGDPLRIFRWIIPRHCRQKLSFRTFPQWHHNRQRSRMQTINVENANNEARMRFWLDTNIVKHFANVPYRHLSQAYNALPWQALRTIRTSYYSYPGLFVLWRTIRTLDHSCDGLFVPRMIHTMDCSYHSQNYNLCN